jgi:CubicO group peptidase (beta-lactamase class C family)
LSTKIIELTPWTTDEAKLGRLPVLCALVVAGLLVLCCNDESKGPKEEIPPRFEPLVEAMENALDATGAPGAAVAVVEGGEVTFAQGFGTKHPDGGDPVEASTLFRIASLTKMLTATAILDLVEGGSVALDTPITDYLPAFSFALDATWAPGITVRHLLTHQSGVVDYLEINSPVYTDDDALASYMNGQFGEIGYLMTPPGRMYNYTNPGYMLAGLIIEEMSGMYYRQYMDANLFDRLGMTRTYFIPDQVLDDGDFAYGETIDAVTGQSTTIAPDTYDNGWGRPAGYAFSSVLDLAEFIRFLSLGNTTVLGNELLQAMMSPQVDTEMLLDLVHYGYGLTVQEGGWYGASNDNFYSMRLVLHNGAIPGFSSLLYYVPQLDLGMVTLASGNGVYFDEAFLVALETLGELPQPSPAPDISVDPNDYDKYVGTYFDPYNVGEVIIVRDGDLLTVEMPLLDQNGIVYDPVLLPLAPRNFIFQAEGYWIQSTFILDDLGNGEYWRTRAFVAQRDSGGSRARSITSSLLPSPERFLRSLPGLSLQRLPLH